MRARFTAMPASRPPPKTSPCGMRCSRDAVFRDAVFREKITGTTADRPQPMKLVAALAPGDAAIIPAVDRLSRDMTDLMAIARDMQRAGAELRSVPEPVLDTTGDFAELLVAVLRVAAKLERRRIDARTARCRGDAKSKGVKSGCTRRSSPHTSSRKQGSGLMRENHSGVWRAAATSAKARFQGSRSSTRRSASHALRYSCSPSRNAGPSAALHRDCWGCCLAKAWNRLCKTNHDNPLINGYLDSHFPLERAMIYVRHYSEKHRWTSA